MRVRERSSAVLSTTCIPFWLAMSVSCQPYISITSNQRPARFVIVSPKHVRRRRNNNHPKWKDKIIEDRSVAHYSLEGKHICLSADLRGSDQSVKQRLHCSGTLKALYHYPTTETIRSSRRRLLKLPTYRQPTVELFRLLSLLVVSPS